MPLTFTPLPELGVGVVCSESLACSDTLVSCSDLSLILVGLIESAAAIVCSELLACSDTLVTCSDAGVGIQPLLEV